MQTYHSLLAKGLHCISKLHDPCYLVTKKFDASDAKWQAGMLAEAPNPDKLMAGRLQVYVHVLQQLFSVAGSLYKSFKIGLHWFIKGIRLNVVPQLHSSHDKAPKWHKHVRIVKHMLPTVSASMCLTQLGACAQHSWQGQWQYLPRRRQAITCPVPITCQ